MGRNIRNAESFVSSWWDWTVYNDCFGRSGIRISDIDGIVERNGWYLWIETKRPHERIPKGQQILFDHVTLLNEFNVMIIWGETDQPQAVKFWRWKTTYKADQAFVKYLIRAWFDNANRHPRIQRIYTHDTPSTPPRGGEGNA